MIKKIKKMFSKKGNEDSYESDLIMYTDLNLENLRISMKESDLEIPYPMFLINFSAVLLKELKKNDSKVEAVYQTILTPKGILDIPIIATINKEKCYIFPMTKITQKQTDSYYAAKEYIEKERKIKCYYFASKALPNAVNKISPFRTFNANDLSKYKEKVSGKNYAMWWSSNNEKKFFESKTQKFLAEIYKKLDGIETYVAASIAKQLGICDDNVGRLKLPDEIVMFSVKGPENNIFILTISQEKGIRFHFETIENNVIYRENLLKSFSKHIDEWKKEIDSNNADLDKYENTDRALNWYNMFEKTTKQSESKGELQMLGVALINNK